MRNNLHKSKSHKASHFLCIFDFYVCFPVFADESFFASLFRGNYLLYAAKKYMDYLAIKTKMEKPLAAGVLLLSFVFNSFSAGVFYGNILITRIGYAIRNSDAIVMRINKNIHLLEEKFHVELISGNSSTFSSAVGNTLRHILGATFNSVTSVLLMYFILYFMLVNTRTMEKWFYDYIPLKTP